MPVLDSLAARATLGRAAVIPPGLAPGSDVGNMSILGYDPERFHTGRSPIEAAAIGLRLGPDEVAFRCNLVTLDSDGTMVDFAGGHPDTDAAAAVIEELERRLGGEASFHAGKGYRHTMVAPGSWATATCTPPHDLTGSKQVPPSGPAGRRLAELMHESMAVLADFELDATQIWLWGQGAQPVMPPFRDHHGVEAGVVSAVDLVRGLGVLTEMQVVDVVGATGWYDKNYEGKRDAVLTGLENGADLFVLHVEASDEAGHAGDVDEKIRALENWDSRILRDLVSGLDDLGPWRMLMLPDHATPLSTRTHTADPVPYMLVDSAVDGVGGTYTEAAVADTPVVAGCSLLSTLVVQGASSSVRSGPAGGGS